MDYRKLGHTNLGVFPLCLGANTFGWTTDEQASFAVLDAYVAAGGNFIDTADTYVRWAPGGAGESERILGRWMQARGNRERVIVATKLGSPMSDDPQMQGLSRRYIMEEVEASLRRLQTDYIDLYQAHRDDQQTPLEETLAAFNDLVQAGKVRALGASNYSAGRLRAALAVSAEHGYARYECLQPLYNLVMRADYERDLEPLCVEQGLGVITYSSLASGFLSGKYRPNQDLPATQRASGVQGRYMNERGWRVLAEVERVAQRSQATPAQVALAWILARPSITAPIASATSPDQLQELLGALDLRLDQDALAALDAASAWQTA